MTPTDDEITQVDLSVQFETRPHGDTLTVSPEVGNGRCPAIGTVSPRPKRFRDMGLSVADVEHIWHLWLYPGIAFYDRERTTPLEWRVLARAKRLLPLWRKWGLRDLWNEAFDQGGGL